MPENRNVIIDSVHSCADLPALIAVPSSSRLLWYSQMATWSTAWASLSPPLQAGYMGRLVCVIYYLLEHWLSHYPILHHFVLNYWNFFTVCFTCDDAGTVAVLSSSISSVNSALPLMWKTNWPRHCPLDFYMGSARSCRLGFVLSKSINIIATLISDLMHDMCVCVTLCNLI